MKQFSRKQRLKSIPAQTLAKPRRSGLTNASLMLALEPRLLFDAALATTWHNNGVDGHDGSAPDTVNHASMFAASTESIQALFAPANWQPWHPALADPVPARVADPLPISPPAPAINRITFIDSRVAEQQTLIAGLPQGSAVRILDPNQDGVAQITRILADYQGLTTIDIISHGGAGTIGIGSSHLGVDNVASYADALRGWSRSLADQADILIYGCDVAAGTRGDAFIHQISQLTGADVAASTDPTGDGRLGGNWTLEDQVGQIEAQQLLSDPAQADYHHTLGIPTLTNTTPADNASHVLPGASIQLNFSEAVAKDSGNIVIRNAANDTVVATIPITDGQVVISGADVTITPTKGLPDNTQIYVQIDSGALKSTASNEPFAGISDKTTLNFAVNATPTLATVSRSGLVGNTITFAASDFTSGRTDLI